MGRPKSLRFKGCTRERSQNLVASTTSLGPIEESSILGLIFLQTSFFWIPRKMSLTFKRLCNRLRSHLLDNIYLLSDCERHKKEKERFELPSYVHEVPPIFKSQTTPEKLLSVYIRNFGP
uniref:Uncharacterized protein n=1 Tax=Daphnia galeata TaxID=27404 RepID=A0A8J2RM59_9CRUS|nr:unnamed protein product [Daphnia galeata]